MDNWTVVEQFFKTSVVEHHLSSFNQFVLDDIPRIVRERNPVVFMRDPLDKDTNFNQLHLYFGGRDGTRIRYESPSLFPNEARLNDRTYQFGVYVDLTVEYIIPNRGKDDRTTLELGEVFLGYLPAMLQSKMCVLGGMPRDARFAMGECRNDPGGYFIVDGGEKVVMPQETRASNMVYVRQVNDDKYTLTVEVRSESEHASKMARKTLLGIVADVPTMKRGQIVVSIPNVRFPIPLFIVMRALGVISDRAIMDACLLGDPKLRPHFIPSVHDAGKIFTQATAIDYIRLFVKERTSESVMFILANYLLPHVGTPEDPHFSLMDKAYYLGFMVRSMLAVATGEELATDRDSFKHKRIVLSGTLLADLFKEYYNKQQKQIVAQLAHEYAGRTGARTEIFKTLVLATNYQKYFQETPIETGFRKAFKGSWGSEAYTKRIGVVQELNRLTFLSMVSTLRKCNLPLDPTAKMRGPRLLHTSQWGLIDPFDTPDGGHIGLQKSLALTTRISVGQSRATILALLASNLPVHVARITSCSSTDLASLTKIFVNGAWLYSTASPAALVAFLVLARRQTRLNEFTSISWVVRENTIYIYTDAGRPQRPLFFVYTDGDVRRLSCDTVKEWSLGAPGLVEYLDTAEAETALIAIQRSDMGPRHTHMEIHGCLMLGVLGNFIVYPEHNPAARNLFSCSQSKQAISVYHTNYQNRMDKMGVVLNYGQTPLVKSAIYEHVTHDEHPYGVNALVAIMCYSGYNTEDAVIFNKSSVSRGMFNVTYYSSYDARETPEATFTKDVPRRPGQDASELDDTGLLPEGTEVNDEMVVIGLSSGGILPKRGQLGVVDRTYMTSGTVGSRLAKVRVREARTVYIGDKFASRAGQKGTCGILLPEQDMPFMADGRRPDLIINPHALPTRMTIGQLVECLVGKVKLHAGSFGDCTAFDAPGDKVRAYGDMLTKCGYHSSGTEIMYNGFTGQQIESAIFIGPTFYMRLKHMVKDKINFRAKGPMTALTRQPVQGRANDGGLRLGEMERDGVLGNGMTHFIQDAFMKRSDAYTTVIDTASGMLALKTKDSIMSPSLDGPLEFDANLELESGAKHSTNYATLRVPYSFKLLMQELQTMNVQMRIVTRDPRLTMPGSALPVSLTFDALAMLTPSILENRLFVSDVESNCYDENSLFLTPGLSPSMFPSFTSTAVLRAATILENTTKGYTRQTRIPLPQLESDVYKNPNAETPSLSIDYFFKKMKTGIFVRIKNNRLVNFTWMYNLDFTNDYHLTFPENKDAFLNEVAKGQRNTLDHYADPDKWHATNCLLRVEAEDPVPKTWDFWKIQSKQKPYRVATPTDQYLAEMFDMISSTCSRRKVGDCMFMLNRKDFPHMGKDWTEAFHDIYGEKPLSAPYRKKPLLPVLSQSTTEKHVDIPIPSGDDWKAITKHYFASYNFMKQGLTCTATAPLSPPPWAARKPVFFWRGMNTGCGTTEETNPRMHLHALSDRLKGLDARIIKYTQRIKTVVKDGKTNVEYVPPKKSEYGRVEMDAQLQYKFTINVEGNSAAYRYGSLFRAGFCILNVDSKYKMWFEPLLTGGYVRDGVDASQFNVIFVKHDLSNLEETMRWCLEHDDVCSRIAQNAVAFFDTYFTREYVHGYLSDVLNGISEMQQPLTLGADLKGLKSRIAKRKADGKDSTKLEEAYDAADKEMTSRYALMKPMLPSKNNFTVKSYTQRDDTNLGTTAVIIPFRDAGDQNRTAQLNAWLAKPQHRGLNVLVVEQTADGQKFNRGALLNAGYDFLTQNAPAIQSFVMHDVDIFFPEDFVRRYYGTDSKGVVHMGSSVKGKTYKTFLGRVIRFSKQAFKETNGFPNNFYGWGGEDDALVTRLGDTVVYRPSEVDVGEEMETTNDIKEGHLTANKELFKVENLVMDAYQWKMNGVNSIQYQVLSHEKLGSPNFRKITVSLLPKNESVEVVYDATGGDAEAEPYDLMEAATSVFTHHGGDSAKSSPKLSDPVPSTTDAAASTSDASKPEPVPNSDAQDQPAPESNNSSEPQTEGGAIIKIDETPSFHQSMGYLTNTDSLEHNNPSNVKVIQFDLKN
jgi:DNA-directed RNA polymerase II subunit RPB2